MADTGQIAQIATLAADQRNLKEGMQKTLDVLTGEVRSGNQQNMEILSRIAVLTSKQEDSTAYQEKCDSERQRIAEKLEAQGRDIAAIKSRSAAISGTLSFIISGGAVLIDILMRK